METSILELLFPSIASCQWRPSGDLPKSFRVGLSVGDAVLNRKGLLSFFCPLSKIEVQPRKKTRNVEAEDGTGRYKMLSHPSTSDY